MRTLEPGDVVFLIDAIALGPTWRLHDRTFEQMAKLKARVVVVLSDHSTIDLSAGPGNDELERIRQEALDEYHRQRIRDGLAVARAAGKRVGRPPFGWPCRDGQVVPPAADLETIGEICRRVEHHETLRAIHADLLCRRIRRADGERWTLPAVSAAFRYGIGLGWASRRRRPWDFVKGRVACRA
ncbi:MAG: hypothetical protein K8U03_01375 [Planctomycetia bacterium]|nr:hypothetical protein [Planctomycetia bacterium]